MGAYFQQDTGRRSFGQDERAALEYMSKQAALDDAMGQPQAEREPTLVELAAQLLKMAHGTAAELSLSLPQNAGVEKAPANVTGRIRMVKSMIIEALNVIDEIANEARRLQSTVGQ